MTEPQSQPAPKPFYRRWWFITIFVILVLGAFGSLLEDEEPDTPEAADTTTTSEAVEASTTTTEPEPTTTTTEPPPTTTTLPPTTTTTTVWQPFSIEGSGDDFFEFSVPDDDPAIVEFIHSGSSNFAVVTYDAANERLDLLVNEIGSYQGRVPINFLLGEEVASIEITAGGSWTMNVTPLATEPFSPKPASGIGDDVIVMNVSGPALDITHDGDSNFAVIAWTSDRDLLVNEIGSYSGTVRSPTGVVIFEITADGNWSIAEG